MSSEPQYRTIPVGIFVSGESEPLLIPADPIPEGFPPKFVQYLGEVFLSGFNLAVRLTVQFPSKRLRGRPISPRVQELGQKGAVLRQQGQTWGQISKRICDLKVDRNHQCGRACADRIRQAAQPYLNKKTSPHSEKKP